MNANIKGNVKGDGIVADDPKLDEKFNSIILKIFSESDSLINRMNIIRFNFMEFLSVIKIFMIVVLFEIVQINYIKKSLKFYMKY